ncbi:MAG: tyrosine-type recombinase/integrase [Candidatus Woesearchaeota archaeon]|nr:MAG: tyrosine-type recombinase/integrase [Candidatus Woesearchaeota archaeon]
MDGVRGKVSRQSIQQSSPFLDKTTLQTFSEHFPPQFRLLFDILLHTGLTVNELVHVTSQEVIERDDSFFFLVKKEHTKDKISRTIPLSTSLAKRIRATEGYLCSKKPSPLSSRRVEQLFSLTSTASGIKLTPRMIRNHVLCALLSKKDFNRARQQLGIRSLTYKQHYTVDQLEEKLVGARFEVKLLALCVFYSGKHLSTVLEFTVQDLRTLAKQHRLVFSSLLSAYASSPSESYLFGKSNKPLTLRRAQQLLKSAHLSSHTLRISHYYLGGLTMPVKHFNKYTYTNVWLAKQEQ